MCTTRFGCPQFWSRCDTRFAGRSCGVGGLLVDGLVFVGVVVLEFDGCVGGLCLRIPGLRLKFREDAS
jgi:hypothetical protein